MTETIVAYVDGATAEVPDGSTLLQACDAAGRYVPRLCHHTALDEIAAPIQAKSDCGLCLVRLGNGTMVLACRTQVTEGVEVTTDDNELRAARAERLGEILARHPHSCLTCSDRDGCSRDSCVHGIAPEARCCDKLGQCELGAVAAVVDPGTLVPRRAVAVARVSTREGRIRREPGLCIACGRCVAVCAGYEKAGGALELAEVAQPKQDTLRESGCTFCGLCVLVCPTGALSAPGPDGTSWLAGRRQKHGLPTQILPPTDRGVQLPAGLSLVPAEAGVMTVSDEQGRVLRIAGVPDLARGVAAALQEPGGEVMAWLRFEVEPLYTQRESELLAQYSREHGRLPAGNEVDDDLFADEME